MAQSEPSLSSRKRSRQTGGLSGIDSRPAVIGSPNPKARKQRKTTPVHEESEEEEDLSLRSEVRPDLTKSDPTSSSKPGPKRRSAKTRASGSETTATPGQKTKMPKVPKTERKTRKKAGLPTTQKSRRKSVPSLPLLAGVPEPESEGEDPLLLVGNDEWVPIPWKPSPANVGIGYIKKEEEDAQVDLEWEGQEPRHRIDVDGPTDRNDEEPFNLPSPNERQQINHTKQSAPPTIHPLPLSPSHNSTPEGVPPEEDSFLSVHPDADSSFVGMEIDSDDDVSEFTVPVRLESPPPRRRRSSNVSQREDTPAVDLPPAKSMSNPLPGGSENFAEVTDQTSTRAIFRQLLQSTPARSNGSKQPARPSTSRILPITPSGPQRRALTTSPYPSPRFTGQKLGSLSPEKGVGPSRGLHPKLGALDIAQRIQQPDEPKYDAGPPMKDVALQDNGQEDIQMEDETDEEELENSLRIERELTEGMNDDDSYPIEGLLKPPTPERISSTSRHNFKLFAKSPSSDDDLIPLFDVAPTEASLSNSARRVQPVGPAGEQEFLLSPKIEQPAASVQSGMGEQDTETGSSDEEGPPVVEITSKEPMAAARAAAILKHWHHYSEEQAKLRLRRRRSSTASVNLSTPPVTVRDSTSFMNLLVSRQTGPSASPIPQHMLKLAEAEILATPPRPVPSASGHGDTQTLNGASQLRFSTPLHRAPSIPEIVINPASSRPSVDEAASQREGGRPWTKMDWKALESCLIRERRRIAQRFGLQEKQVDAGEVDVDIVVTAFMDQNRLVGDDDDDWEGEGEWDRGKIRRRCMALQVRHSQQPAGSIVVPGSPLVIPFTPLQSRQTTPVGSFIGELGAPSAPGHPLPTQRSISPIIPLSTSLLAPRYVHLYEEASAIAGLSSEEHDRRVPGDGSLARPHDSSIPSDGSSQERNVRDLPPSRIPVPLTKARQPSASAAGLNQIKASLPSTTAGPASPSILPVQATPSTASRVLGFLGLRGILRGTSKTAPSPTPIQKRGKPRAPSPPPNPIPTHSTFSKSESPATPSPATPKVQTETVPNTSRILARVASPMPVAQVIIPISKSKEDLNHVEPTPSRPSPRIPHPKELVALHPVPPKPSVTRTMQPRRSSGGSVKDLVKTFETLESQNAPTQQGPQNNYLNRRRFGSGSSLRRVPSNLSTCSVISVDSLDPDRSMNESLDSISCTPEPPHATQDNHQLDPDNRYP
ncbi:hypothetical protein M407DRAFT_4760 [Tulasnella calospora MUT 4182]|uniref:Uncharacterized protein n=1 Tax=Tulasnella calospora MUT 4182 TaxID=1051891 RepID=A0A0C3LD50_9AGAM|nr:hypothetical protein M407DRAFT_4760 [Tulasnella calospora MUT 4182]